MPTVAGGWPRGRLAIVLGAAVALHLMTFWNLESSSPAANGDGAGRGRGLGRVGCPAESPRRDNAAIIYEQAAQRSDTMDWSKIAHENAEYAGNRNQGWNFDAKDPGLRPFLRAHAATIALLHKAASKPGCYFEHDYYLPEWPRWISGKKRLWERGHAVFLDARTKAADGDARGAIQDINTLFAMSHIRCGADGMLA